MTIGVWMSQHQNLRLTVNVFFVKGTDVSSRTKTYLANG